MLLDISLELLEDLLESLDPVDMPVVSVPELHHDLHFWQPEAYVQKATCMSSAFLNSIVTDKGIDSPPPSAEVTFRHM